MRSAIHARFGDPASVLAVGDSPVPEPGPGEVRIRMQLAPIHNHDLLTIRGQYGYRPALPVIGGSEGLGVDNVFSTATPGWMGAAKSLLGDGLASAAVDSIGGRASAELMAQLGENGVLVSFGALSGELRLPVEAVLICPTSRRQPPQACGRARKGKVLLRA